MRGMLIALILVLLFGLACFSFASSSAVTPTPTPRTTVVQDATQSRDSGRPTPQPTTDPLNAPCCLGALQIAPVLRREGGRIVLRQTGGVALTWPEAPRDIRRVEFYFAPEAGGLPWLAGLDENPADGTGLHWFPPLAAQGALYALAINIDGSTRISSPHIAIRAEYTPPPPSATPVPLTPTPTHPSLRIDSFSINASSVKRGGTVTLSWSTRGASAVQIQPLTWTSKTSGDMWIVRLSDPITSVPTSGTFNYPVPVDARRSFRFDLHALYASGVKVTVRSDVIDLIDPPCFFDPKLNCSSDPIQFPATAQSFERGYMLRRGDTGGIYIMAGWWLLHPAPHGEVAIDALPATPPPGTITPANAFGRLWAQDADVRQLLGWATSAEENYTATAQQVYTYDGMFDKFYLSWPDGRIMHMIGDLRGSSGPSAGFPPK